MSKFTEYDYLLRVADLEDVQSVLLQASIDNGLRFSEYVRLKRLADERVKKLREDSENAEAT